MKPLARRVMLRALAVAVLCWFGAALWGIVQLRHDVDEELGAALSLARTLDAVLQASEAADPGSLQLAQAQPQASLRHLTLTLRDNEGQLLLRSQSGAEDETAGPLGMAAQWLSRFAPERPQPPHVRVLSRPQGDWTLTLAPDAHSERLEALGGLLRNLTVMGLAVLLMLLVMGWTLQRGLNPLHRLAQAISGIRPGQTASAHATVQGLASGSAGGVRGVREVQEVSSALRALAQALNGAEAERRVLAQRLLSAQEAERARLARELHDEWGQRLTALRLDATLMRRHVPAEVGDAGDACRRIAEACAGLQRDLQQQLRRLAPRELQQSGDAQGLHDALQDLVLAWDGCGLPPLQVALHWVDERRSTSGRDGLRADLLLTLYRLSQEALTNTVRHAQASVARLEIRLDDEGVAWLAEDNGRGLPDPALAMRRGSGLAQLRERAWAQGADLSFGTPASGSGTRLQSRFSWQPSWMEGR